ncbi:hypothetical protein ACGTN6_08375 [Halomonas sp. THAF12]|uniref:hypothetical protein n=1 Tax=Halomonas sp. B23F22_10 TaxID=3459515 RepID=UPI00373F7382
MSRTCLVGVVLLVLAAASALAERILYGGRLDTDLVVQESFFLPLSFLFGALGVLVLAWSLFRGRR